MDTDTTKPVGSNQPQKYIRTFEGDMAIVQNGGVPDLVPLATSTATSLPVPAPARAQAAPTTIPLPESVPAYVPPQAVQQAIPRATEWNAESREETLARMRANAVTPQPSTPAPVPQQVAPSTQQVARDIPIVATVPSPVQKALATPQLPPPPPLAPPPFIPPPTPAPTRPVDAVHTYSEDFSQRVKDTQASTATILAAQQDAGQGVIQPEEKPSHTLFYAIAGTILAIFGGVGSYYAYTIYGVKNNPVVIPPTVYAPIGVDEQKEIMGEGVALLRAVEESQNTSLASGAVRQLYSASATTTRRSIFASMLPSAPSVLMRNINGASSMAGIINVGGKQSPFFILAVSSYNDTFAGMLAWERTLAVDLGTLYPPYPVPPVALVAPPPVATTIATTTKKTVAKTKKTTAKVATTTVALPPPPAPVFIPAFHDEVINNHDARVFRDEADRSVLLYGYWNATTLVIARDTETFIAVINRLASSHTQQ